MCVGGVVPCLLPHSCWRGVGKALRLRELASGWGRGWLVGLADELLFGPNLLESLPVGRGRRLFFAMMGCGSPLRRFVLSSTSLEIDGQAGGRNTVSRGWLGRAAEEGL
eukprot:COSAG02_NODE_1307_length_13340_cov_84.665282_6_plen_109_part_00